MLIKGIKCITFIRIPVASELKHFKLEMLYFDSLIF